MARTFSGTDKIETAIGSLVGINMAPLTLVAIVRRNANGAWHAPISIETSANSSRVSMEFSDTNTIQLIFGSSNKDTTVPISSADGWVLAAVSKAGGSSVPRGHKYVYSTKTWTHTDAAAASGGDSTDLTGGKVKFGQWQNTDVLNGDMAVAIAYKRVLTDAEVEMLPHSLPAILWTAPSGLWLFDQAATTTNIIDLTGNGANQTTLTGTSVASSSQAFRRGSGIWVNDEFTSAGPITVAVNQTTETDTSQAINRIKSKLLGQNTETDTAQSITRQKIKVIGIVSETDTSQPIARIKTKTLGINSETNTAQALTRRKTKLLGLNTETDTALTVTPAAPNIISFAEETDSALAISRIKSKIIGQASETDSAISLAATTPVETASEVDTALTIVKIKSKVIGQASEVDSAIAVNRQHWRSVNISIEADAAQLLHRVKVKQVGQVVETDIALPLISTVKTVNQAAETDTANIVNPLHQRTLTIVTETDLAQPVSKRKTKLLGQAFETDTALIVTRQIIVLDPDSVIRMTESQTTLSVALSSSVVRVSPSSTLIEL